MVSHMKTTIQIPDSLFEQARLLAQREDTTLKALMEEGLRRIIAERESATLPFRLRDASFGGDGLQSQMVGAPWSTIRDMSYEGRGG